MVMRLKTTSTKRSYLIELVMSIVGEQEWEREREQEREWE